MRNKLRYTLRQCVFYSNPFRGLFCSKVRKRIDRYTGIRSARLSNVSRAKIPFEFRDGGDLLENKALLFVR